MTKEQIDILIKDSDLIPGNGLISFREMEFSFSRPFYETLEGIFEWYLKNSLFGDGFLTGNVKRFQMKIDSRINEVSFLKNQKINFLNNKIQEEIQKLENLRIDFPWEMTINDIKESWICHLINDQIESLIEDLKFKILEGRKIEPNSFPFINLLQNFHLLDRYFLSNSMYKIYEAAAIEKNIEYLQAKIENSESEHTVILRNGYSEKDYEEALSEIKNSENKFSHLMDMGIVINHFQVLTEKKNKEGNPYLSKAQFLSFLKKGFLNDAKLPKQKINCLPGEKGIVILLFYKFYEKAVADYSHHNKKEKFLNLFVDCFDNWEPRTIPAFFKKGKTRNTW